jgi:hypothetical protein
LLGGLTLNVCRLFRRFSAYCSGYSNQSFPLYSFGRLVDDLLDDDTGNNTSVLGLEKQELGCLIFTVYTIPMISISVGQVQYQSL